MFGKSADSKKAAEKKEQKKQSPINKEITSSRENGNNHVDIPILIVSPDKAKYAKFLIPVARFLLSDKKKKEIDSAYITVPYDYLIISFILSSLAWAILLSGIVFILQVLISFASAEQAAPLALATFILSFLMFFYLHYIYPSILAKKVAETADFELLHVLREMWIDATSGVTLYNVLVNVARGGYGNISKDIEEAVREISIGERDVVALEKIAEKSSSENFKRILWHLSSSVRTGVGLTLALDNAISMLSSEQMRKIREYGASLNFYLLLYLLFAAVIPSIVLTFFSILSAFGLIPITFDILFGLVIVSSLFQIMLIGLMRAGRPNID